MTALVIAVKDRGLSLVDIWLLTMMGVVMLPILAIWIDRVWKRLPASIRRIVGAFVIALVPVVGVAVSEIFIRCKWWMVECWF